MATSMDTSVTSDIGFFKLVVLLEDSIKLGVLLEDTNKTLTFYKIVV